MTQTSISIAEERLREIWQHYHARALENDFNYLTIDAKLDSDGKLQWSIFVATKYQMIAGSSKNFYCSLSGENLETIFQESIRRADWDRTNAMLLIEAQPKDEKSHEGLDSQDPF